MYLVKTPKYLQEAFPSIEWRYKTTDKVLYLTFDDGPTQESTHTILEILQRYDAKATFFCVGDNIKKFPTIHKSILDEGHKVGSHTYNHLSGWTTTNQNYYSNIHKAAKLVDSPLFRPPYGRITPNQSKQLSKDYRIVMWDVLSGDFDRSISAKKCVLNVTTNAKPGSVVVFHDSEKTSKLVAKVLPQVLEYFMARDYQFKAIT